ncbi:SAV_915 family protein [Streptomyces sp. enrichment culture]|uniref:SAV_915 family protein n=1 Tax=Streptomyces sp. enrichment culture TaxID=1795815 RepID=UPI003F575018
MPDARRNGDPTPGGHPSADLLYVPVRPQRRCCVTCFFRTPGGPRTAVAFTSCARLLAVLGQDHPWIRLSVTALRALTAPLGCTRITVDPQVAVRPAASRTTRPGPGTSLLPGARTN